MINIQLNIFENESSHEFSHMVNQAGNYKFKMEVYPFSIKGLDYSEDIEFVVKESSEERKKKIDEIENREKKLKIEPSLFQQMLSSVVPIQEEDQDEEEEEEEKEEEEENDAEDQKDNAKGKGRKEMTEEGLTDNAGKNRKKKVD